MQVATALFKIWTWMQAHLWEKSGGLKGLGRQCAADMKEEMENWFKNYTQLLGYKIQASWVIKGMMQKWLLRIEVDQYITKADIWHLKKKKNYIGRPLLKTPNFGYILRQNKYPLSWSSAKK